ncbi:MAG: hydrogenase maturation protease [Terrimicrobiaceae bacterium]
MNTQALVIGLGNEYRSDDAVGRAIARKLRASAGNEFRVKEGSGEGGALMDAWNDADFVVLVDAVESGGLPGTIRRMDARTTGIPSELFHCSAHGFGVSEAIELARALKRLPARLIVYGIEGRSFALGAELTPEVEAAADEVVRRVKDELSFANAGGEC